MSKFDIDKTGVINVIKNKLIEESSYSLVNQWDNVSRLKREYMSLYSDLINFCNGNIYSWEKSSNYIIYSRELSDDNEDIEHITNMYSDIHKKKQELEASGKYEDVVYKPIRSFWELPEMDKESNKHRFDLDDATNQPFIFENDYYDGCHTYGTLHCLIVTEPAPKNLHETQAYKLLQEKVTKVREALQEAVDGLLNVLIK